MQVRWTYRKHKIDLWLWLSHLHKTCTWTGLPSPRWFCDCWRLVLFWLQVWVLLYQNHLPAWEDTSLYPPLISNYNNYVSKFMQVLCFFHSKCLEYMQFCCISLNLGGFCVHLISNSLIFFWYMQGLWSLCWCQYKQYKWFLWVYCMFGESEIPENCKSSQKNTFETKKMSQSVKLDSQL